MVRQLRRFRHNGNVESSQPIIKYLIYKQAFAKTPWNPISNYILWVLHEFKRTNGRQKDNSNGPIKGREWLLMHQSGGEKRSRPEEKAAETSRQRPDPGVEGCVPPLLLLVSARFLYTIYPSSCWAARLVSISWRWRGGCEWGKKRGRASRRRSNNHATIMGSGGEETGWLETLSFCPCFSCYC